MLQLSFAAHPLGLVAAPLVASRRVLSPVPRALLSCADISIFDAKTTAADTARFAGAVVGTLKVTGQDEVKPSVAAPSVWVEALPPAGFVWADESVYSTVFVEPAAKPAAAKPAVAKPAVVKPAASKPAAAKPVVTCKPVQSWYDRGVRLTPPVTSWYDVGIRLETPPTTLLPAGIDINKLIIKKCIGKGTQSEVLLGELPGGVGEVAVKVGIKRNAIAREAPVLSAMSGFPCFPMVHHHEPHGPLAAGGFLIVDLLGPSLEDLWQSESRCKDGSVDGQTLLRIGRGILRPLRQLHFEGFVHNDIKPANILLGAGSSVQPTRLHLIDFGSCTQAEGHACASGVVLPPSRGPIGTLSFASLAADGERERPMRPADDIESLVFTLAFLTKGSLPWQGKPDVAAFWKRELLTSSDAAAKLTEGLECATAAAALQELLAEVRRCHGDGTEGSAGASLNYEACLAALGGETWEEAEAENDALSEFALMTALGGGSSEVEALADEALSVERGATA